MYRKSILIKYIFLNVSADELLDLNIQNSYYSLNKENTQIVNRIKNALLLSQKNLNNIYFYKLKLRSISILRNFSLSYFNI